MKELAEKEEELFLLRMRIKEALDSLAFAEEYLKRARFLLELTIKKDGK